MARRGRPDTGERVYTNYAVASAASVRELRDIVVQMMDDGWEPAGGIAVSPGGDVLPGHPFNTSPTYLQAMVLR